MGSLLPVSRDSSSDPAPAGSPRFRGLAPLAWTTPLPLAELQADLAAHADETRRAWWERWIVGLAPSGTYAELIVETAERLVRDPARSAQTRVAWVIRELARARPDLTEPFLH